MTITLKKQVPLVVPLSVQRKARLKAGDRVEFKATAGMITIVSKLPAAAPTTDEEYTAQQRRFIDAQLAEGLEDIRKGRVSRRFDTVDEMLASMKAGRQTSGRRRLPSR